GHRGRRDGRRHRPDRQPRHLPALDARRQHGAGHGRAAVPAGRRRIGAAPPVGLDRMARRARTARTAQEVTTALYGISFGALATASGLDVWQACVLSLVMFSGGSQFALIGVLASGGTAAGASAIAGAALLGSRNTFYALRLSRIIGPGFFKRAAAAPLTIDESTAVATSQTEPAAQRLGFWATGI